MKLQRKRTGDPPVPGGRQIVSPTQRDLFLSAEREPGGTTYSLGLALPLPRPVDPARWEHAMALVVGAESALRLRFGVHGGDVVGWVAEQGSEGVARTDNVAEFVKRPYDLARDPLVRSALAGCEKGPQVAVVAAHHIVLDAPGGALLLARLWETYRTGSLPPVAGGDPFSSYAAQSRLVFDTPAVHAEWTRRLSDAGPLVAGSTVGEPREVSQTLVELPPGIETREAAARLLAAYGEALATVLRPAGAFVVHDLANSRRGPYRETIGCLYQVVPVVFPPRDPTRTWLEHVRGYRRELGDRRHISVSLQRRLGPAEGVRFHFNFYSFDRLEGVPAVMEVLDSFPDDEAHLLAKPRPDGVRLELHHPCSVDGPRLLAAIKKITES
ncbi:condensation domain-containing protein [Micromonospora sp. NPDC049044]|uniref:condensation domain-containing protein n=1 Tax=unclassified Micromonospora TaxID=2617518 RepID=UPI0033E8516A